MLYIHENNINGKINQTRDSSGRRVNGYKNLRVELETFKAQYYLPFRERIESLIFDEDHIESFETAAQEFNTYYQNLVDFSDRHGVRSQSKFESTFLEEISSYLFKNLPQIQNETFGIFNKGIYAGLKIDSNNHIAVIKKDVDFCIGKKANITIDNQASTELILPIVAVEVKTYLDATMFGEIKSSSKSIRSASPNSRTYVLMGYRDLADEHIIAARQDSALTEMFALRRGSNSPILSTVLLEYWKEIKSAVESISVDDLVPSTGRLLNP